MAMTAATPRTKTEDDITNEVLRRFDATSDPRLRQIMQSLVTHLHAFVRDVALTEAEWMAGIEFLTATGHKSTGNRQEFILLSDTLGVSALVNILASHPTESTTPSLLGPFFRENAPMLKTGDTIAPRDKGEAIEMVGKVTDKAGKPIAGALIDIWQTGSDGLYDIQGDKPEVMDLRGRFLTEKDGTYRIRTALPIGYGIPMDGPVGKMLTAGSREGRRPAHVHFLVKAQGYEPLITHVFLEGDQCLTSDAVFGVKDELVSRVEGHDEAVMADGKRASGPWHVMTYDFQMKPGTGVVPQPLLSAAE